MVSSLNIFNIEQNLVNIYVKERTIAIFKTLQTKMMNNECDKFTNLQFFFDLIEVGKKGNNVQ